LIPGFTALFIVAVTKPGDQPSEEKWFTLLHVKIILPLKWDMSVLNYLKSETATWFFQNYLWRSRFKFN